MTRNVRPVLSMGLATVLIIIAVMPAFGQKRKAPAKPAPKATKPAVPPTPYEQGYAVAYGAGYTAGQDDYSRGTPRDLRANPIFQNRDQHYDPKFADAEESRQ